MRETRVVCVCWESESGVAHSDGRNFRTCMQARHLFYSAFAYGLNEWMNFTQWGLPLSKHSGKRTHELSNTFTLVLQKKILIHCKLFSTQNICSSLFFNFQMSPEIYLLKCFDTNSALDSHKSRIIFGGQMQKEFTLSAWITVPYAAGRTISFVAEKRPRRAKISRQTRCAMGVPRLCRWNILRNKV
jgi:hypothetical protein